MDKIQLLQTNLVQLLVEHWQMVEIKAPLPLDSHVEISKMVAARSKTNEACNEESVALYELPTGITVDDDSSEY